MSVPKYKIKDIKDIAGCFEKLHLNINQEFSELKTKIGDLEARVETIESHAEHVNEELTQLHNTHIPNLEERIDSAVQREQTERIKLELWGRKWNLIIKGIPGKDGEDPRQTVAVVKTFLSKMLKMSDEFIGDMIFTAAHRLKGGPFDKKAIIIRLSSLIDRDDILKAAQTNLASGCGYSVMPDLPPVLAERRNTLLKERSEMSPEDKKNFKVVYSKQEPFVHLVRKKST